MPVSTFSPGEQNPLIEEMFSVSVKFEEQKAVLSGNLLRQVSAILRHPWALL